MNNGRKYDWKLIFRVNETIPGQRFTCCVESRYPFRGSFFVFPQSKSFLLVSYTIGPDNQFVGDPVPLVVLDRQPLVLSVGLPGSRHELTLLNNESTDLKDLADRLVPGTRQEKTHLRSTEFIAELHGQILVGHDENPVSTVNEMPIIASSET